MTENNNISNNFSNVSEQPAHEQPKTHKKGRGAKIAAFAICLVLLCGGSAFGGMMLGANYLTESDSDDNSSTKSVSTILTGTKDKSSDSSDSAINVSTVNTDKLMTASEIYAQYVNSTVGITTSITTNYFGYQTTAAASGSGFIITDDGYIVTNYHVIEDADSIKVTTYDGTSYDARLIGIDENNDLAVIKINADGLTPVVIGSSDDLNVGDNVIAIGNPLGELTFSLTSGVVSALDREVTMSNALTMDLIQTDCAINSGNSGGALFNMYGEVVGITNAKYSSSSSSEASIDNIGFAIPISDVMDTIESIIEDGVIKTPYIGVSVGQATTSSGSGRFEMSYQATGAMVVGVTENSPAEKAGLKEDDVITAVDGKEIAYVSDLTSYIASRDPGDEITLTIERDGEEKEIKVTVGEQTQKALPESENMYVDG